MFTKNFTVCVGVAIAAAGLVGDAYAGVITPTGTAQSTIIGGGNTAAQLITPADLNGSNQNIGYGFTNNWTSAIAAPSDQWVYLDLGANYDLATIDVWQYLEFNTGAFGDTSGRGVNAYQLFVGTGAATLPVGPSTTPFGAGWTSVLSSTLAIGPNSVPATNTPQNASLSFNALGNNNIRYVGIDVISNYGDVNSLTGLGQIQVTSVPEPSSLVMLLFGGIGFWMFRKAKRA